LLTTILASSARPSRTNDRARRLRQQGERHLDHPRTGRASERADQVHERAIVALHDGHPVELQLLYPDLGVEEPIAAVAGRYDLDRGALEAAARSALAVPDRVVVLDVLAPAASGRRTPRYSRSAE
jgi:hypothetical protein